MKTSPIKDWYLKYRKFIALWLMAVAFIFLSITLGIDKRFTTIVVVLFGFATEAFSGFVAIVSLIPLIGPFIAKILAWPIFLTINGLAYLVTFIAVRRGQTKEAINARLLVSIFLLGIVVGIIIGKLL